MHWNSSRGRTVVVALSVMATGLLWILSLFVLWLGGRTSSSATAESDHLMIVWYSRMTFACLVSQACTCTLLLVPALWRSSQATRRQHAPQDSHGLDHAYTTAPNSSFNMEASTALYCVRASNLGTSMTGLAMTVLFVVFDLTTKSTDSASETGFSQGLWWAIPSSGMLLWVTSCASLMISFWPSHPEITPGPTASSSASPDGNDLTTPLLSTQPETADTNEIESNIDHSAMTEGDRLLDTEQPGSRITERTDEEAPPGSHCDDSQSSSSSSEQDNSPNTSTSRIRGTRRLLQLAAPQVLYLYAGCAVLLLRLPFSLSIPHFVSATLSAVHAGDFARAKIQIVLLLIAGSIDAALDFWCVFLFGYANLRIVRGVRLDLFRHLIRQEVSFFDQTSSGELASRLQSDCSEMAGDLTWFFRFSIESVVRIFGITTYMVLRSPTLGACALSIAPIVATINKFYGNWLRKNAEMVQDALAEANSVAQEALANIRTVIAFAAERGESDRYESKIQTQYKLNVRQLYMTGMYYMTVSTFLINTLVQGLILYIGTRLIQADRLTAEILLAFMLYQGQLQNETLNLFQSYSSIIKSSGAGDNVFALLDRKPPPPSVNSDTVLAEEDNDSIDSVIASPESQSQHQYNVELKGVSFAYPSRPQQKVLDKLDLVIPMGKTVALVGVSGCGKSTIINLLQRFYDPTSGSICIDGVDLRRLDLIQHRRRIGVVTQDPRLFNLTLMENIRYGSQASREEAIEAAILANADDFIRSFPDEYETQVGEGGIQLSGGQKQRIAIARAIVKKPSLLILDEATSALDAQSERIVQDALDKLLKLNQDMTTVVVAHRLRTVQNADCIAVLHDGRVVELGTHNELVKANADTLGRYRKMVEQASSSGVLPDNHVPE